jgi:hypothetical protein
MENPHFLRMVYEGKSPQKWTTGWWFGTFFIFPYFGNFHPSQLTRSYFSEGLASQNHQPDYHPIINHY